MEHERDDDPTLCTDCNNTGFVVEHIDGGRLVAEVPCGCPQSEASEEDEAEEINVWRNCPEHMRPNTKGEREVRVELTISAWVEVIFALRRYINQEMKDRRNLDAHSAGARLCRKGIVQAVRALKQCEQKTFIHATSKAGGVA